jgi:hypothetical protein
VKNKPTRYKYFWLVFLAFLTACGNPVDVLLSDTPIPTFAVPISPSVTPVLIPTETYLPLIVTPSPYPTELVFPLITPDAVQVANWQDYEDAIAEATFSSYLTSEQVVCEWIILGQTDQEVYVWANCASIYSAGPSQTSIPTVIYIGMDGSVQDAKIPGAGTHYASDIRQMFPSDVQEMIFSRSIFSRELWNRLGDRLRWRRGHPDEPPWIVLNSITLQPTQPVIPITTPDLNQVEKWKEYQIALARELSYLPPEEVICEWEILGRTGNEIYVWAICGAFRHGVGLESLARVNIRDDGSVFNAMCSDAPHLYPSTVLERYYGGVIHFQELVDHLRWRLNHPEEPPLIVRNATLTP